MNTTTRFLLTAAIPLLATGCASTKAFRHKNGTLTVSRQGFFGKASSTSYWITGAAAGRISPAEDLTVFRKVIDGKPLPAVPLKCSGFVDATEPKHVEVRLVEKQGGSLSQAKLNGRHKLIDANTPKPFYHWLIP